MFRSSLATVLALGLCALSCVKGDDGKKDGAAASKTDGPASAAADAMVVGSCKDIRNCVYTCGQDQTCADRCVAVAPQAARALYQQATMCSEGVCPTKDVDCRCMEECLGGMCTEIFDECDEATSDKFCDISCH